MNFVISNTTNKIKKTEAADTRWTKNTLLIKSQSVAKVSLACYYHLRRLRQIRIRVRAEVTTQLVLALVMSRLDYCNAVLVGVPQSTLEPLQRIQNAAARLVHQLDVRVHVTPSLTAMVKVL